MQKIKAGFHLLCGLRPHLQTFLKKSLTKNFTGKTNVFPYKANIFKCAERSASTEAKRRHSLKVF